MNTYKIGAEVGAFDRAAVEGYLPHRDPFLFIDEVTECVAGKLCRAVWRLRGDEFFFQGHFPQYPLLPGVLQYEAIAQTGAIAVLVAEDYYGKLPVLGACNGARFRQPVRPGDTLELEAHITHLSSRGGRGKGIARVNGKEACSGELMFAFAPNGG